MNVALERLMHWDLAPENPGRLAAAGVKIALTSHGLSDAGTFLAAVRKAVKRGLDPKAALDGADRRRPPSCSARASGSGTLEAGKAANLVVTDGPLFDEKTKVLETWVDGQRLRNHQQNPKPTCAARGHVDVANPTARRRIVHASNSRADRTKLSGKIKPRREVDQADLAGAEPVAVRPPRSKVSRSATTASCNSASPSQPPPMPTQARGRINRTGHDRLGRRQANRLRPNARPARSEMTTKRTRTTRKTTTNRRKPATTTTKDATKPKMTPSKRRRKERRTTTRSPRTSSPAISPVNFPARSLRTRRAARATHSRAVSRSHRLDLRPQGRLGKGRPAGRIRQDQSGRHRIWKRPKVRWSSTRTGKHISPGIIDCHSHIATDGGVNESGQTITAEVRIGDFIDPNDISIYRQLAGGVTASNILHGSANTIGGQNQVLKFRWGAGPRK